LFPLLAFEKTQGQLPALVAIDKDDIISDACTEMLIRIIQQL